MAVEANPQAAFQSAFQTFDTSNRAWEQLALQQQEMQQRQVAQMRAAAQQAVENARQQQAFDFNRQLEVLRDKRQARQDAQQTQYQDMQAQTSRMNADTSRMELGLRQQQQAQNRRNSGDPFGLMDGDLPVPGIDAPPSGGFSFGGQNINGDWGPTSATVFGGQNDPEDNGLSAFGGPTGPGGREGVAIPQSVLRQTLGNDRNAWQNAKAEVTLADGSKQLLPVADLGTAEHVWQREGRPVLDLTPGAAQQLGGRVLYNSKGQQTGVTGVDIANVRVIPPGVAPAAETAVAAEPPTLLPDNPLATSDLPVPDIRASNPGDQLLPPPQAASAIAETDLTAPVSDQLFQLQRDNRQLAVDAAQAKQYSTQLQRALPKVSPAARPAYFAEIAKANTTAQASEAQAFAGAGQQRQIEKQLPVLQKRQDALMGLSALDGVLPDTEVQALVKEAADVRTGGAADRKINVLSAYGKVRDQFGLDYPSAGFGTAEKVARVGAQMTTPEAVKARDAFTEAQALTRVLAADEASDTKMDTKVREGYKRDLVKLAPGVERWNTLQNDFKTAVAADTRPDPNVVDSAAPVAAPAAPAGDIFSRADQARAARTAGQTPSQTPEEQQQWSEAKNAVKAKLGGDTGIESILASTQSNPQTLSELKTMLKGRLTAVVRPGGASDDAKSEEIRPFDVKLSQLPKNARKVDDVVDALAEDIWKATGRDPGGKVISGAPGISPEGRVKAAQLLEKLSK